METVSSSSVTPASNEPEQVKTVSTRFNAEDADITFQSADGILYFIHRKNLESCAGGFPPAEFKSSKDDVVSMTETSHILDLLFVFMYPEPTPDVKKLPFYVLADLAEAAEKYQVFSAMTICNIYMTAAVNEHPIEILRYAAMHRYVELLDTVAKVAMGKPLDAVVVILPLNAVVAWVRYHQRWRNGLEDIYKRDSNCSCNQWKSHCLTVLEGLGGKVESMLQLDSIFSITIPATQPSSSNCYNCGRYITSSYCGSCGCTNNQVNNTTPGCCSTYLENWKKRANEIIAGLPKFSSFLFP